MPPPLCRAGANILLHLIAELAEALAAGEQIIVHV
jgi:hypothetical protein